MDAMHSPVTFWSLHVSVMSLGLKVNFSCLNLWKNLIKHLVKKMPK